jgi:hypothetical protein
MSKLLLKIIVVIALLAFTLTQDCCFVPPDFSQDLYACNVYFGHIGCPNAICGMCMGTNEMFSADPGCPYPC